MSTDFGYVRAYYGVPAERGRRVVVDGDPGVIAEARGNYIGVLFDQCAPTHVYSCHPTWRVTYLDEIAPVRRATRSQIRYQQFLDADTGLTFGEYLRSAHA